MPKKKDTCKMFIFCLSRFSFLETICVLFERMNPTCEMWNFFAVPVGNVYWMATCYGIKGGMAWLAALVSFLVTLPVLAAASSTFQNSAACEHLPPFLFVCPNGTKIRDTATDPPHPVPPSANDTKTGVSSKDILVDLLNNVSARIYLPTLSNPAAKIPILVYFHGGAFIIGAPWFPLDHLYLNKVSSVATALVISVDYRKFPEHEMPVPYDDAWKALQWLAQAKSTGSEPWVSQHGDFHRVFVGGDSAGGTIAHNLSVRAAEECLPNGVKIKGAFLGMPYFLGSLRLPLESRKFANYSIYKIWQYLCPHCVGGVDHPYINPLGAPGKISVARLGVEKIMVTVAEKDSLRQRDILYSDLVSLSGWRGEVLLFDTPGEGHTFHILSPDSPNTKILIDRLATFVNT